MRQGIYNRSVNQVKEEVLDRINNIEASREDHTASIVGDLIEEGNKVFALSSDRIDSFIEINEHLSKDDYHFPDVVNMGELVNYIETPSKILENDVYKTRIPFLVPVKESGISFFMNEKYRKTIMNTIESIVLKLIGSLPNGLARVSLIDKTGAGQNFKFLSTLHEKFIEGKVLSSDNEIELELEGLKNSMSIVASSVSGNGFNSIEDYNLNTDEVPQSYRFVVVSNFPTGFNKKASENLLALIESGHKAGIYVFLTISLNSKHGLSQNINGLPLSEYIKNSTLFEITDRPSEYVNRGWIKENTELVYAPVVKEKEYKKLLNSVFSIKLEEENEVMNREIISILNNKIEDINLRPIIDIEKAIPTEFWTKNADKGICVPFAKRGIESVYFSIGVNQYEEDENTHHAIISGATGSGKSVIINDFILEGAMYYSPNELAFYLLDFKEGTEFAMYKDFPYVEILSMESEIEFGHEVLANVISEIEKRGKLFKKYGANNLVSYNNVVRPDEKLKRVVIIIDEFQSLFPKNPKITMKTNELIDDILRRGRSFGFNLILGTQTLKGVDLDPSLLSNIPLRVGLKMDDKDSIKVFGEGNTAPQFLENPGEGIYNNSYGKSKSNVSFQAFRTVGDSGPNIIGMLNNHIRRVYSENDIEKFYKNRVVYSGVEEPMFKESFFEKNREEGTSKIYVGEPTGLSSEDSSFSFEKSFAENLIMVGQEQSKALSLFYAMIYQNLLLERDAKVYLVNYNTGLEKKIIKKIEDNILPKNEELRENIVIGNNKDTKEILDEVYELFLNRKEAIDNGSEEKFETIYFYQFFIESSKLFSGDSFRNPELEKLTKLISDGPEYGIHSVYYASDYSTLSSYGLSRELTKFKKKIAFKGGDSLKLFNLDSGIKFSKSDFISIMSVGYGEGEGEKKFKPYNAFREIEEDN